MIPKVLHLKWCGLAKNPINDDLAFLKKKQNGGTVEAQYYFFLDGDIFVKYDQIIYLMAIGI